jgi:hypothetical protein
MGPNSHGPAALDCSLSHALAPDRLLHPPRAGDTVAGIALVMCIAAAAAAAAADVAGDCDFVAAPAGVGSPEVALDTAHQG